MGAGIEHLGSVIRCPRPREPAVPLIVWLIAIPDPPMLISAGKGGSGAAGECSPRCTQPNCLGGLRGLGSARRLKRAETVRYAAVFLLLLDLVASLRGCSLFGPFGRKPQ